MCSISRIVVKGSSGYGPYDEAYDDCLTITHDGLQHVYKPLCISEKHQPRKWSYRTDNPEFEKVWNEICYLIPDILSLDEEMVLDGCETRFTVTFENKTKIVKNFWSTFAEPLGELLRLMKKMVPDTEEVPEVLRTGDE